MSGMRKSLLFRFGVVGIVALAAAWPAAAATFSSPVHPSASPADAARMAAPGQAGLDLDAAAFAALRRAGAGTIRIEDFPISPETTGRLILKRFEVAAPGAKITITGPKGETSLPFPSIAHFSGRIDGDPDSSVYVGAQEGRLVAYLRGSSGFVYVGPDESGARYVVRSSDSPLNDAAVSQPWSCAEESLPAALTTRAEPTFPSPANPTGGLQQANVRIETDNQLYVHFGSDPTKVATYVATLFGAIDPIYESELALHLAVAEVHVWSTPDPYTGSDTMTQLLQLGDWWHANRPMASYPRTYVHYLSGHPVSGGIAWVGVLCSGDFPYNSDWGGGYGLTQVFGTYPLQAWDQYASAHEMGHNCGSPHTHCMGPPTYPDWTDECYSGESGCYSGPTSVPPGKGTIMSYCHLLPGGFNNVNFVFHTRCINDKMLPEIASASCLTQASTFIDVPPSHPFYTYVETLVANSVTAGCQLDYYCPDAPVTRAQMAVFLLRSKYGASHVPPPATGTLFADVHVGDFAADWIEELANLGITAGCTPTTYCPGDAVTREQMAVLLLKSKYGPAHVPPPPAGIFADVPVDYPYASWIEELYSLAITTGCQTGPLQYCPTNPNTRGEMAVFLVRTFSLQ